MISTWVCTPWRACNLKNSEKKEAYIKLIPFMSTPEGKQYNSVIKNPLFLKYTKFTCVIEGSCF